MSDNNGKLQKIGALWMGISQGGKKYLSGAIQDGAGNDIRVVVFPNGFKEDSKHPDFVVYLSQERTPEPAKGAAKKGAGRAV